MMFIMLVMSLMAVNRDISDVSVVRDILEDCDIRDAGDAHDVLDGCDVCEIHNARDVHDVLDDCNVCKVLDDWGTREVHDPLYISNVIHSLNNCISDVLDSLDISDVLESLVCQTKVDKACQCSLLSA
jgi:hypothetical protein